MKKKIFIVKFLCGTDLRKSYEIPALNESIALSWALNKSAIQGTWCEMDERFSVSISWNGCYKETED